MRVCVCVCSHSIGNEISGEAKQLIIQRGWRWSDGLGIVIKADSEGKVVSTLAPGTLKESPRWVFDLQMIWYYCNTRGRREESI